MATIEVVSEVSFASAPNAGGLSPISPRWPQSSQADSFLPVEQAYSQLWPNLSDRHWLVLFPSWNNDNLRALWMGVR